MMRLGDAQVATREAERQVRDGLLCAVLDAGVSKAMLSRVTGYSRRQVARLLSRAIEEWEAELSRDAQEQLDV
jgi:hypothetical protein